MKHRPLCCMPCRTPCKFVHPFKLPWSLRPLSSGAKCPLVSHGSSPLSMERSFVNCRFLVRSPNMEHFLVTRCTLHHGGHLILHLSPCPGCNSLLANTLLFHLPGGAKCIPHHGLGQDVHGAQGQHCKLHHKLSLRV